MQDYSPRTADDVTDELVELAIDIVNDARDGERVYWEDVWNRLERRTLNDGRGIDLGCDLSFSSPALVALKRRILAARRGR